MSAINDFLMSAGFPDSSKRGMGKLGRREIVGTFAVQCRTCHNVIAELDIKVAEKLNDTRYRWVGVRCETCSVSYTVEVDRFPKSISQE